MKPNRPLAAVPERPQLTPNEKAELAAHWADIMCRMCGSAHGGVCPRVKRMRTTRLPNGTVNEDVEFFRDGQWSPHPDAVTPRDVFGPGGIPPAPVIEAVSKPKKGLKL